MTRVFKIQARGDYGLRVDGGSELRFRGQWLRDHGFRPGETVAANLVSPVVIELRVVARPVPDPEFDRVRASLEVANAGFDALRRAVL